MKRVLFVLFSTLSFLEANLDFSKQVGILENIKTAILPLMVGVATLAFVIAGFLYITGKGNIAKETLINIIIGSIVVGIGGTLAQLLLGN